MNKSNGVVMLIGGLLMVISTGLLVASMLMSEYDWASVAAKIVPWTYIVGSATYVVAQRRDVADNGTLTLRRLYSIQLVSGICFVLAGLLMVENVYHFLRPLIVSSIDGYFTYIQFVHNNWVVLLLVGAILQMYTTHRISSEMKKIVLKTYKTW